MFRSNIFWRNTRTEKHRPDPPVSDPLATDPPTPTPAPASARKFKCVGCDCVMTADGQDIWHAGDRYKNFMKQAQTIEKKDEEIAKLTTELANVRQELAALRSPGSGSSAAHRPGARLSRASAGS